MDATHEPSQSRRKAVRPLSAPPFCEPNLAPPRPYRPATATPPPASPPKSADRGFPLGQPSPPWDQQNQPNYPTVRNGSIVAEWASDELDDDPEEGSSPGWVAIGRGVALLLGTLLLVDLFSNGGMAETGPWWLNTQPIPVQIAAGLLGTSAVCLLLFAARGALPRGIRGIGMLCLATLIVIAIKNTTIYYGLLTRGDLHDGPAIAFSLHVVSCLAVVLFAIRAAPGVAGLRGTFLTFVGFTGAALAFPIAHIACQGTIDARQSAVAAIVAGPRPFATDAEARLQQCMNRAVELYQAGLVPRLVLTATTNKDHLAQMKKLALEAGIPQSDIKTRASTDLDKTLAQLAKQYPGIDGQKPVLLVISAPDHLPRLLLEERNAPVTLAGVPSTSTFPSNRSVFLRELRELWRSYLQQ